MQPNISKFLTMSTEHHTILSCTTLDIVASTSIWASAYAVLCAVDRRHSYEWFSRSVTLVHACLVVLLSAWCGFVQGPWPFTDPGGPNTPLQYITCLLCLGYFIFDFLWCLYFQTEGVVMLVHHALSIIGNLLVVYQGAFGTEMIAVIFGAEFTNPFLQMRWFLRETNRHLTWYGEINDFIFMASFGILRLGIGSYLLYCYLLHPRPILLTKFGGTVFYLVGWLFYVMIIQYAIKKYTKMYHTWKKNNTHQNVDNGVGHSHKNGHSNGLTHRNVTSETMSEETLQNSTDRTSDNIAHNANITRS